MGWEAWLWFILALFFWVYLETCRHGDRNLLDPEIWPWVLLDLVMAAITIAL